MDGIRFLIVVEGEIDTRDKTKEVCIAIERSNVNEVYVDLSNVRYVNTFFLNGLVQLKHRSQKSIYLVSPNSSVAEMLTLTQISHLFPIVSASCVSAN
jgi:anti-anti-sigma factor